MLQTFSIIYMAAVGYMGGENAYLFKNIHDINALMAYLSLAFLCMAFVLRKEKEDFRLSFLPISLILFFLYSAATFYFSSNADLSMYPVIKLLGALFLGLALIYFFKNIETLKKAFLIVFSLSGIIAASGIVEQFFPFFRPNQRTSLISSQAIFVNANWFAAFLVVHVPIGVYLYFGTTNKFEKFLLGFAWIVTLISLCFSNSQGGQLTVGLQVFITIGYFLVTKKSGQAKIMGYGVVISFLTYLFLKNIVLEPNLLVSKGEVDGPEIINSWLNSSVAIRLMYWKGAWRIFLEHWLLGSGLWTFIELYPQTGLDHFPTHAHNLYLQTAAETGLIGLGLLLACLTTVCFKLINIYKNGNAQVVEASIFIGLSLLGFFIHNIIEYNWLTANFIYYFVFLIISVEVLYRETSHHEKKNLITSASKIWSKAIVIIIVLGVITVLQYYRYQKIVYHDILKSSTEEEMLVKLARANEICTRCGMPYSLSGTIRFETYRRQPQNKKSLLQAEQDFNEVVHRNPYDMYTYMMLGRTKSLQGNFFEAGKYYLRAMKSPEYIKEALAELKNISKNIGATRP